MAGLYLPQSDCECYYQALDLLNDALAPIDARITNIEGESKIYNGQSYETKPAGVPDGSVYFELDTGKEYCYYGDLWNEIPCCGGGVGSDNVIYLNKYLHEWICSEDRSPDPYEDLYDLLDQGYLFYYFSLQDGNMYWSTGAYDRGLIRIYFTKNGESCTDDGVTNNWLGAEFSFFISQTSYSSMRQHFYGIKYDISQAYLNNVDFSDYTSNPPSTSDVIGMLVCGSTSMDAYVEHAIAVYNSGYRNCFYYFNSSEQRLDFYEFYPEGGNNGKPYTYLNGVNVNNPDPYIQFATHHSVGGDEHIMLLIGQSVPI